MILSTFVLFLTIISFYFYGNKTQVDVSWLEYEMNEALKMNESKAKQQYGEAFKSPKFMAKISNMDCKMKDSVNNCLVSYTINERTQSVNVFIEKGESGWKLNKPISIK